VVCLRALRIAPRSGVRNGEHADRHGEDEHQGRARVAQRPARQLEAAERSNQSATASQHVLGSLGESGEQSGRNDGSGEEAKGRRGDEQRIRAERPLHRPRQRRSVQPKLPQRDGGRRQQRQIDAQPLCERLRLGARQ
jgi:hypothetical protein